MNSKLLINLCLKGVLIVAYNSSMHKQILDFLNSKFENDRGNIDYWKSKHLLRICEICIDIKRYEEALECCSELLKLNPESQVSETLLQIQKDIKKKTATAKNNVKKEKTPTKNNPNTDKKSKQKKKKTHNPVIDIKLNIPKECSNNYTPNSRYQLRCDEAATRKYGLW